MTARKYADYDKTLPVYNRVLGDMISALKAALITGYNGTPSVDWELVYESQSNPSDTTKRIAVRSKSVNSEQKIFEITDISRTEGSIKCWDNWSGSAGVNLLMQAKINKNNSWGSMEIVADEKFVHLVVNACYHGFGDVDVFDTSQNKTVILDRRSTSYIDTDNAIASSVNESRNKFIDRNGNQYICRSFCKEQIGYGARINWNDPPVYDIYNGGDRGNLTTNILTPVRKTELLKVVSSANRYDCYGYLPMFVYSDNPITMHNRTVEIDGKTKYLRNINILGGALILFAVDV
jgi:hypothetical protein